MSDNQPSANQETGRGLFGRRVAPRSPSEVLKATAAPPPPPKIRKRRSGLVATLSASLTFLLVVGVGVVTLVAFARREYSEPGPLTADKTVIIRSGSGSDEIASQLQREGVIAHPSIFLATVYLQSANVQAGEYVFPARASMKSVIAMLDEGKVVQHSVTVPEGLTSLQIVERLQQNELLTGEIREVPAEGSLLPDTYRIQRGMSRQRILDAMAQAQRRVLAEVWGRRSPDLPLKTPQELVTLASIVEKETGRADERTRVAGVFFNRLQKRMRLQSDPTIVYGLVGGKGTLGRGILRSEINQPTPYNTYTIDGLPPGPIANPGRAAMEAVANPSRTKDLYFVADGTGGHAFAETLDQHNRNVARWRQVENARREANQPSVDNVDKVEPPAAPETRSDAAPAMLPTGAYPPSAVPGLTSNRTASRQAGGFDAVEGTDKDPLRNKTFDLNSPQTVPPLRR